MKSLQHQFSISRACAKMPVGAQGRFGTKPIAQPGVGQVMLWHSRTPLLRRGDGPVTTDGGKSTGKIGILLMGSRGRGCTGRFAADLRTKPQSGGAYG